MKHPLARAVLLGATLTAGVGAAFLAAQAFRGGSFDRPTPPPPGYVAARAPGYALYAPSAAALREGVEELEHARRTFRDRLGVEPVELVVVLADSAAALRDPEVAALRRPGAGFLPFVTRAAVGRADATADSATVAQARFRAGAKTLAHEACHQLVAGYAEKAGGRGRAPAGYGHGALPDWVDEMAATLCESPDARARRREHLRASLAERIPLAELAVMEHPVSVAVSTRPAGSAPVVDRGATVQVLRGDEAREFLRGMNAPLFYSQSLSLGEFLSERGGPEGLRTVVDRLARGRTLDQALADARRRAPALPGSVAELEVEWLRWVEAGEE